MSQCTSRAFQSVLSARNKAAVTAMLRPATTKVSQNGEHASVLVPLHIYRGKPSILFTIRSSKLTRHRNQVRWAIVTYISHRGRMSGVYVNEKVTAVRTGLEINDNFWMCRKPIHFSLVFQEDCQMREIRMWGQQLWERQRRSWGYPPHMWMCGEHCHQCKTGYNNTVCLLSALDVHMHKAYVSKDLPRKLYLHTCKWHKHVYYTCMNQQSSPMSLLQRNTVHHVYVHLHVYTFTCIYMSW